MITILVTGGRDYIHREVVYRTLDELVEKYGKVLLHHGACPTGVDAFASDWAFRRGASACQEQRWPADWKKYGRNAGPIRNGEMLRGAIRDGLKFVVAFPGGAGTADMLKQAMKAGQHILRIR